jgi:hypothetical protein
LNGSENLKDVGLDRKMILKQMGARIWTGFV